MKNDVISCQKIFFLYNYAVAPLVGAWIEIAKKAFIADAIKSLPLWERGLKFLIQPKPDTINLSLPLWERGLKSSNGILITVLMRRSPCGSVD